MGSYTPSHVRRRKKRAHDLELENADLRRRISTLSRELEMALERLRHIASYQAWIEEAAREINRRAGAIGKQAGSHLAQPSPALERERRSIEELELKSGRSTLYVSDRRYSPHD